jgi:signal transduction histidine kinase
VTSGLDAATVRALGVPPTGHGLLGLVIEERRPLLVGEIAAHPRSVGFPPGHPTMHALLAVPVLYQDQILGSIYVADREDGQSFSVTDQESLERFAAQVAIAVANAWLYGEVQRLSLVEERERIGMDLHDGVLQSLYATALGLEAAVQDVAADPPAAERAVTEAIERLHATIRDIRHYIFDLRATQQDGASLRAMLEQLLEGLRQPGVELSLDVAPDLPPLPRRLQWEAWHVAREAVSNALRHSGCRRVALQVALGDGCLVLRVEDDGRGFDAGRPAAAGHRGLANMRRRAEAVGGTLSVGPRGPGGTAVALRVPLPAEAGAPE